MPETMRIYSGDWESGELVLRNMPKEFMLSARQVFVLELDEFEQVGKLQDEAAKTKDCLAIQKTLNKTLTTENEHLTNTVEATRQDYEDLLNGTTEAKLQAENEKLREEKSKAYMAANRTSIVFFENRDDAEKYAGRSGATSGIEITEIHIIPSPERMNNDNNTIT